MLANFLLVVLLTGQSSAQREAEQTCGCIARTPAIMSGTSSVPGTPAQPESSCLPISLTEETNGRFTLSFGDFGTEWYYNTDNVADVVSGRFHDSSMRSTSHPATAGVSHFASVLFPEYRRVSFIGTYIKIEQGKEVQTMKFSDAGLPTYPMDAAMADGPNLYVMFGTKVFTIKWEGGLKVFDWLSDGTDNPFRAQSGSPLSFPPANVTALLTTKTSVLAFQQNQLYIFTKGTGHWELLGDVPTPCDCESGSQPCINNQF